MSSQASPKTSPRPAPSWLVQGSVLGAGVVLAAMLTGMVNYVASRHYARFDWTANKVYSLSEKSLAVLEGVDRDIDAIMFLTPQSGVDQEVFTQVSELLDRYQAANARITKRVIDPARDRLAAARLIEEFGIERANAVVLAAGDDRRVLDGFDFVEYDYSGASIGQGPSVKAFRGEQLITSAILELIEDRKPKVLFTTGHGEAAIDGVGERALAAAQELLGRDNFEVETWSSLGQAAVPDNTDLVVVAGPTGRFLEPEAAAFEAFLGRGGRMLLLLDPVLRDERTLDVSGLESMLGAKGVQVVADLVIDPAQRLPIYGPETLFTDAYGTHPIVDPLIGRPVILQLARSVRAAEPGPPGASVSELVSSSSAAWAETDLADADLGPDEGELRGPIALGVAVSWTPSSDGTTAEARLVVIGDSDFATDLQIMNGANAELLLGAFNWLIERESLLAIPAREPEQIKLLLSASELRTLNLLALLLLPGAAVVAGVVVHLRRRR